MSQVAAYPAASKTSEPLITSLLPCSPFQQGSGRALHESPGKPLQPHLARGVLVSHHTAALLPGCGMADTPRSTFLATLSNPASQPSRKQIWCSLLYSILGGFMPHPQATELEPAVGSNHSDSVLTEKSVHRASPCPCPVDTGTWKCPH